MKGAFFPGVRRCHGDPRLCCGTRTGFKRCSARTPFHCATVPDGNTTSGNSNFSTALSHPMTRPVPEPPLRSGEGTAGPLRPACVTCRPEIIHTDAEPISALPWHHLRQEISDISHEVAGDFHAAQGQDSDHNDIDGTRSLEQAVGHCMSGTEKSRRRQETGSHILQIEQKVIQLITTRL